MLSRRRRVSSSSSLRYNDNIRVDINGNEAETTMAPDTFGALNDSASEASTETSTTSQYDNRMHGTSTVHVEHRNVVRNEGNTSDRAIRRMEENGTEDYNEWNRGTNDISLAMSSTSLNCRRLMHRVGESSRHRRRKSVEMLDRNVDVFQNSCSTMYQRVAIDSDCSGIAPLQLRTRSNDGRIDDSELTARITNVDGINSLSASIYPKIPDNDKISSTKCGTYEASSSINWHRTDDIATRKHVNLQRRNSDEMPRAVSYTKAEQRSNNATTMWKQWACRRIRRYIVIGLLMWITLMTTEVAGRQNHHRTCPGCPHQHVHNIHRKGGSFDERGEATSDTETAPSPDDLRLEAIKHQILTKLGLRTRPDINRTLASVPRTLALETLYRAEAQAPGHSIESDDYNEDGRAEHRHGDNEDEDSLLSPLSPSSSLSSLSSSSSAAAAAASLSSLSSSSSSSSSSLSSSISSSSKESSSSSSYGQFYYDGEKYSYRNVDQGAFEKDASSRTYENVRASPQSGSYFDNESHRGHGDYPNGGKARDYRVKDENDEGQIEVDDFYARTSEIISFAEPGRTLNGQPLLEFPQSSGDPALEPLRIKRATLWARVELRHAHHYQHHRRAQLNQRNITLWVFRVRCGNVTHLRGKELGEHLEMITSLGVNVNQLGWQKFDVTKAVSNWYSGHEFTATRNEKLTLLVDCTGCGSHVYVSTFGVQAQHVVESSLNSQKGGPDPDRPFLVVRTDPAAVKRVRRRAIECSGAIKGQCCKQRFYVSFSQLGWDDWIIAPQGYYANYCRGDCAAGHRTPDTFLNYYTHVIEEYRKMDRLAGMQPCCAPLKFSSMSLIYYGPDSNIIKRDLPKMVVDECGCP